MARTGFPECQPRAQAPGQGTPLSCSRSNGQALWRKTPQKAGPCLLRQKALGWDLGGAVKTFTCSGPQGDSWLPCAQEFPAGTGLQSAGHL